MYGRATTLFVTKIENCNIKLKRKKSAFTLAEVLITLVIIGVIAAITIPALVANYQNEAIKSSLKKNYSALKQALNRHQAQNGERILPEDLGNDKLKPLLMSQMNTIKDCGFGTESAGSAHPACVPNLNQNSQGKDVYRNFNNTSNIYYSLFDDGQFVLNDGSLILIENPGSSNVYISVDVNGFNRKPNRLGKDLFMFQLTNQGELLPMGTTGTAYVGDTYCSKTSTSTYNGASCTYKMLQ